MILLMFNIVRTNCSELTSLDLRSGTIGPRARGIPSLVIPSLMSGKYGDPAMYLVVTSLIIFNLSIVHFGPLLFKYLIIKLIQYSITIFDCANDGNQNRTNQLTTGLSMARFMKLVTVWFFT
jgi:hypothetical protein